MTEVNEDEINVLKFHNDYDNLTDFMHEYVNCVKLDVYFRVMLESEEALIPNAVKNRHKLKILKGYLEEVGGYPNARFVDSVRRFINLKTKVFFIMDRVPIAFKILNLAINGANEEKKTLEVQLDANEQIVIANTKVVTKEKEKEKIEENIKTDNGIYSYSNKAESYPKENIKDNNEEVKQNKSKIDNDERQSTKQGSSNTDLNVDVTDIVKLKDAEYINNRTKNTVEEKLSIEREKFANNHEGDNIASQIIEREKRDVLLESVKPSNKTIKPSPEEKSPIKSEVSNQDKQILLKYLNLRINGFELKFSFLEKVLEFLKKFECTFSFSEYYSSSEKFKDETEKIIENYVHDIDEIMNDLHFVNDAKNIKKNAIRSIFLDQTTTVSTSDIQKVNKVSSFAVSKKSDKSTSDDIFELDSQTLKYNNEADKLVKNIRFKINTDGKKIFLVGDKDFKASESKQVVFNCINENIKISFTDSQICVSTESSEFHISIRKPKSVDILDNCTQTESTQ